MLKTHATKILIFGLLLATLFCNVRQARAEAVAKGLYDRVTPSLVAVQYVWQSELGRNEWTTSGVVVREDGLIATSLGLFSVQIPDTQMTDFKIIVPHQDAEPEELEAIFQGRDERTNLAFLKAKEPRHWTPLKFEDVPVEVGDTVRSVGLLAKVAAYKTYFMEARVAATLRGEVPQVLVGGGLTGLGSPVFNTDGKAIGLVGMQGGQTLLLNNANEALVAINTPPKFYVPARDFLLSFEDPPLPDNPIKMPWIGTPQLTGVTKDVADVLGLGNQPAIQVGDVIDDAPAAKAGLKQGDIVVKLDGNPLERGDESSELPSIFRRRLLRMKPGKTVTLSVMRGKDTPLKDIEITLGEQPSRANTAKRFWAEDLGFAVRDMVFLDSYSRKLSKGQKGVVVALMRPQGSAETGGLHGNDLITQLNGQPVIDVLEFERAYQDLRAQKPKAAVVLVVQREGHEDTLRIEPPQ